MKHLCFLPAHGLKLLLLSLVVISAASCYRTNPSANVQDSLRDISRNYGTQWPTNYSDAHAGLLRITGRGVMDIIVVRIEVDKEKLQQWGVTATNTLEKSENSRSGRDPLLDERFPWWDIPNNTLTTYYGRKVDTPAMSGRLDVNVVLLESGRSVLYIESTVQKGN